MRQVPFYLLSKAKTESLSGTSIDVRLQLPVADSSTMCLKSILQFVSKLCEPCVKRRQGIELLTVLKRCIGLYLAVLLT